MSVVILDFGSQYSQLIAKIVRRLNIYCEIFPYNKFDCENKEFEALILSGSPDSVGENKELDKRIKKIIPNKPILGICYGAQYLANLLGAKIANSKHREYGRSKLSFIDKNSKLLKGINIGSTVWMSHGDCIVTGENNNFQVTSKNKDNNIVSFESKENNLYGLLFHPEVYHTEKGLDIFNNFLFGISKVKKDWNPKKFVDDTISSAKEKINKDKVILAISGGIDSTLTAFY